MISSIPNQIVSFGTTIDQARKSIRRSAIYHQPDDVLKIQFKNEPCGGNEFCDPSFNALDVDLVLNGGFTTNPAVQWSYTGLSITWDTISKLFRSGSGGGGPFIYQTITLEDYATYKVSFQISNYTGPDAVEICLVDGGATVKSNNLSYLANGVCEGYLFNSTGATRLRIFINAGVNTEITDVSLERVAPCIQASPSWLIQSGGAVCQGGTDPLTTITPSLTVGRKYKITISIANRNQGGVIVLCGQSADTVITTNGEQDVYLTCSTNGYLKITPSDSFDGTVTLINQQEIDDDHAFALFDENGTFIASLTEYATYFRDRIILPVSLSLVLDYNGDPIPYGCYKIGFADQCINTDGQFDNIFINGRFKTDASVEWSYDMNWIWDPNNLYMHNSIGGESLTESLLMLNGNWFYTRFSVAEWTNGSIQMTLGGAPGISRSSTGTFIERLVSSGDFGDRGLDAGAAASQEFVISELYARPSDENLSYDEFSDLITYQEVVQYSKFVSGTCNEDALGFVFSDANFELTARLRLLIINPRYPSAKESYLFRSGYKKRTFAQREKIWDILFDYVNEQIHDTISAILCCDDISIEGENYISDGEYEPDFDDAGRLIIAQGRGKIQKSTSTIFNHNIIT